MYVCGIGHSCFFFFVFYICGLLQRRLRTTQLRHLALQKSQYHHSYDEYYVDRATFFNSAKSAVVL